MTMDLIMLMVSIVGLMFAFGISNDMARSILIGLNGGFAIWWILNLVGVVG